MSRYWIVICPEPYVRGGVWARWYREGCVATGWPPPEWPLDGPTDSDGWKFSRAKLKQIEVGDKVVPYLLKKRIGPVGTVTEKRIADHEWHPTVERGEYTLNPDEPELGRRILLEWEQEGMPPGGKVAVVPVKGPLALRTVQELSREKFDKLCQVLSEASNWVEMAAAPEGREEPEAGVVSSGSSISVLERDLQKFVSRNLHTIEAGLKANAEYQLEEFPTDVGFIDLLCQDKEGNWVVIELKAGTAGASAVGQILGYLGWVRENLPKGENARGIIICKQPTASLQMAAKQVTHLAIKRFQLTFTIEDAT